MVMLTCESACNAIRRGCPQEVQALQLVDIGMFDQVLAELTKLFDVHVFGGRRAKLLVVLHEHTFTPTHPDCYKGRTPCQ